MKEWESLLEGGGVGKREDVDKIVYTCVVDKIQEKKKKKEKVTYGGKKKGKVL